MTAPWQRVLADRPDWPTGCHEVTDAIEDTRSALAGLNGPRGVRDRSGRLAAAAAMRAARASAALDGAPLALDPEAGSITDPRLAGSVRVAAALGSMVGTWRRAPLQVLAKVHTLAAADLVGPDDLGRPRTDSDRPELIGVRLRGLADLLVRSDRPAPLVVAIVHGELLALAPFGSADGVAARAAARLTTIASGLDGSGVALPEVAHLRAARDYRAALDGYLDGGADGLAGWVVEVCRGLVRGAAEGRTLVTAAGPDRPHDPSSPELST